MTTKELIEKYGIGHNCLSDAYALGMMHGLDGMEGAVSLAEKKARLDAIDECIKAIEESKSLFDNTRSWTISEKGNLQNRLRKLKEQEE